MAAAIINYVFGFFRLFWLTGPVFEKELRVSSRQRRNYFIRFAYVFLLLIIMIFVWVESVSYRGSNLMQISRMARAGKDIVIFTVWFQFCAAQIVAVIMLSNSISDEIYHKTLGTLMTTPITSLQIVVGKLLSKLLQLILLLAISLPLLAIIRVFGGVPWDTIISSLCLTFTTVLLVSMVSLFYSIFCRRAYAVIILTVLTFLVIFGLLPFLFASLVEVTHIYEKDIGHFLEYLLVLPNPYITFFFNSFAISNPGWGGVYLAPYITCAINIGISIVLLIISIILVRKVALRQATGQLRSFSKKKSRKNNHSSIRSIIGPPILWKDLILPFRKRFKLLKIIGVLVFLAILCYSYWFFIEVGYGLDDDDIQATYALIFIGLAALFTIVMSAVSITTEKESNAWPLLLTSTISDREIVFNKLIGILSRCFPLWLLLIAHIIFLNVIGVMHPIAITLTAVLIIWFAFFICSTGMYFSSVFKHTTTAVVFNFISVIVLWGLIPLIFAIIGEIIDEDDIAEIFLFVNPFIQILVIVFSTTQGDMRYDYGRMKFSWPDGWESYENSMLAFGISFFVYTLIAIFLLWRVKERIRRKIF